MTAAGPQVKNSQRFLYMWKNFLLVAKYTQLPYQDILKYHLWLFIDNFVLNVDYLSHWWKWQGDFLI